MNRNEYMRQFNSVMHKCFEITAAKNRDYASDADPFANFRLTAMLGVPMPKGILVRMGDKLARITQLLDKEPEVVDESIKDTLLDLAVYSIILYIMQDNNDV